MWLLLYQLFYHFSYLIIKQTLAKTKTFRQTYHSKLQLSYKIQLIAEYIVQSQSMESILTKSMMKLNPNSKELADLITFVPLLEIEHGRIVLHPKGLKVIESQVLGNVHIIALEGDRQSLLYNFYKSTHILSQLNQERRVSGIWVSSFPRHDRNTETQYLFLETSAINYQQRIRIHTICSLICSCILVSMQQANLWYLASLEGRVIYSRNPQSAKQDKDARKRELAHLILYSMNSMKGQTSPLRSSHNEIYDFLNEKKVYLECESTYKGLHMFKILGDRLQAQDWQYVQKLQQQIKSICSIQPKNPDLLNGPILSWYLQEIVQSLNTAQNVQIQRCLKSIQVTEGYNAFLEGVEAYHQRIRKEMKEDGVPNLREVLQIAREEAVEEYKKNSTDAQYLVYLGDYIDNKQARLTEENNKIFDLKNINYLKVESQQLLNKVAREKMDQSSAQKEIDLFTQRYKARAQGDNRYELFSNYLKYLNAAVYKTVSDRQTKKMKKEVQTITEEKLKLQSQIKQLQSRANRRSESNNNCCSSCQVM